MALRKYDEKCRNVVLSYNGIFNDLIAIFFAHSFPYKVVYTDGFISEDKRHLQDRTPFGIIIKGFILRIDAPDEEMTTTEALPLLLNEEFAGYKAFLPTYDLLCYLQRHLSSINRELKELGGTELVGGWYGSCNEYNDYTRTTGHLVCKQDLSYKRVYAIHMNSGYGHTQVGDKIFIRLVYDIY